MCLAGGWLRGGCLRVIFLGWGDGLRKLAMDIIIDDDGHDDVDDDVDDDVQDDVQDVIMHDNMDDASGCNM